MVDRAAEVGAPFMAGSSLVLGWRKVNFAFQMMSFCTSKMMILAFKTFKCKPWLEHPLGSDIDEAVGIGYSGLDIYGFHALEALQCMVERRAGGEVGLAAVQVSCLLIYQAPACSTDPLTIPTAVQCLEGEDVWRAAAMGRWSMALAEAACDCIENKLPGGMVKNTPNPAVFLLEYRDGFCAAVLMLEGYVSSQVRFILKLIDDCWRLK